MTARMKTVGLRAGSVIVLLLVWWIAAQLMHDPEVLPSPTAIAVTIADDFVDPGPTGHSATFHIVLTLARIFAAFAASMVVGIAIGLVMGRSRLVERALLAVIPLMLTIPTILMVFLAVMWFGFSEAGGLVAVMAVVMPYVAVNIFEGAKAMDKSLIDMGVAFKAQQPLLIRKVYLPQLMPYIFSAFRYAFRNDVEDRGPGGDVWAEVRYRLYVFFLVRTVQYGPGHGLDRHVCGADARLGARHLRAT